MKLSRKLLAGSITAMLMSAVFVAHADEVAHCTFKYPDGRDGTFNFEQRDKTQRVVSDFGSTAFYRDEHLMKRAPVTLAANLGDRCGGNGNDNCDTKTLLCFFNPSHAPNCPRFPETAWGFLKRDENAENWLIRGTNLQTKERIDVQNAKCTSSLTNPINKLPW
jgi:hypothetical protein